MLMNAGGWVASLSCRLYLGVLAYCEIDLQQPRGELHSWGGGGRGQVHKTERLGQDGVAWVREVSEWKIGKENKTD